MVVLLVGDRFLVVDVVEWLGISVQLLYSRRRC